MKVLVTFDIEGANEQEREAAYVELKKVGLSRLSEIKKIRLPYTTLLGVPVPSLGATAAEIGRSVAAIIAEAAGHDANRLAVAIVSDWHVWGSKDSDLAMTELLVDLGIID